MVKTETGLSILQRQILGRSGHMFIEGWPLFDAPQMTVIIITTVGYVEAHSLSTACRLSTILIILSGLGVVVSFTSHLAIR